MFNIFLHENKHEYISKNIQESGIWEPWVTQVMLEIFRTATPNHLFIDVGANIGWFSLLAASKGLNVIAFEPISKNYQLLEKSVQSNNFSQLICSRKLGLGETASSKMFSVYPHNMGLCGDVYWTEGKVDDEEVVINTLDNELVNNCLPLIVKIDAEEMEIEVLRGMKEQSQYVNFLFIEIARRNLTEVIKLLLSYGFIYCIVVGSSQDMKQSEIDEIWTGKTDYLKKRKYYQEIARFKTEVDQVNLLCIRRIYD